MLRIYLLYFTVYHSSTNDNNERINQTVKIALRHYLLNMKNLTKRLYVLSKFQSIFNNSISTSIIKIFNNILYKSKSKQSLNLVIDILEIEISKTKIKVTNVLIWIKLNQKRNYDKNYKSLFFKKECSAYLRIHHDYFILLLKNMIGKWLQRKIKSFRIIKRIENLTYRFELSGIEKYI